MSTLTATQPRPTSLWAYVHPPIVRPQRAVERCATLETHENAIADSIGQRGFFWSVIWIPAGMGVYLVSQNSDQDRPFLTRVMDKYAEVEEKRTKRNDLHVRMIEQAGEDRVLFMNAKPQEYVDMRFPEYVQPEHEQNSRHPAEWISFEAENQKSTAKFKQDDERRLSLQRPRRQPGAHDLGDREVPEARVRG